MANMVVVVVDIIRVCGVIIDLRLITDRGALTDDGALSLYILTIESERALCSAQGIGGYTVVRADVQPTKRSDHQPHEHLVTTALLPNTVLASVNNTRAFINEHYNMH